MTGVAGLHGRYPARSPSLREGVIDRGQRPCKEVWWGGGRRSGVE